MLEVEVDLVWVTKCRIVDVSVVADAAFLRGTRDIFLFECNNYRSLKAIERLMTKGDDIENSDRAIPIIVLDCNPWVLAIIFTI